jgi:hypothetical protein
MQKRVKHKFVGTSFGGIFDMNIGFQSIFAHRKAIIHKENKVDSGTRFSWFCVIPDEILLVIISMATAKTPSFLNEVNMSSK